MTFDNYRPISILPLISKILERILHTQISTYFTQNDLLYQSQYGFRKLHSTQMATLELIDRITNCMATRKQYVSIFMDLGKAFDTIDHDILLKKLHFYGFSPAATNLIRSYLSNRKHFVVFKGVPWEQLSINLGVPQGSILGSLLFILYINDIHYSTDVLQSILYADDSTFSLLLDSAENSFIYSDTINNELDTVNQWLRANRMCLNVKKTKFMVFNRTRQNTILDLKINETKLEQVSNFNFLGLVIAEDLNWQPFVNVLTHKLSRSLGIMNRLKSFLPRSVLRTVYFAIFHCHLNYQILSWGAYWSHLFPCRRKQFASLTTNITCNTQNRCLNKVES